MTGVETVSASQWEDLQESANLYERFATPGVDYDAVAEHLRKVTGAFSVAISSFLEAEQASRLETICAPSGVMDFVRRRLGYDPRNRTWPIDEESRSKQLTGRLVKLDGLHEISFRRIPRLVCQAIEHVLGFGECYGIGFVHREELLGSACIIMPAGRALHRELAEVHARLLATNLHRGVAETARARSDERWRSLVEHSRDAVFVVDLNARYVEVNPAACAMLDYSREELLEMGIPDLVTPERPEGLDAFITLVREGSYFGPIAIRRRDGTGLSAEINAVRLPDGNYLGTVRDLTERKRAEEALLRETALEERERARLEFLQIAAHELRTPMTAIKGACGLLPQLLPSGENHPDVQRLSAIIDREVDHLSSLLDEILQAFRLQAGRLPFTFIPVDLRGVVLAALAPFTLGESGSLLVFEGVGEGVAMVNGDPRRLDEVVRNLVHNALKYSRGSGTVDVRLTVQDDLALLTVTDHGIGIPPEELAEIFEAFHRASNLGGCDPGGLGLSLKICRDIVVHHQGRLWADSEPGSWTTFFVELPLANPTETGQATSDAGLQ